MRVNNKILKYILLTIVLVVCIIVLAFVFKKNRSFTNKQNNAETIDLSIFSGVPSDAVMVFYFDCLSEYKTLLEDTSSFSYGLFDYSNPLVELQQDLLKYTKIDNVPFVYSLHYSSKNSVSFLQILNFEQSQESSKIFSQISNTPGVKVRDYNNIKIYTFANGLTIAIRGSLLLASNSSYVLESSIRHFANNTSMLDNQEFANIVQDITGKTLIINNKQIGKFFSGEVSSKYLGYSDFFHTFSNWSVFNLNYAKGKLFLDGYFKDNKSEKNFSNILYNLKGARTDVYQLLPASTVFLTNFNFTQVNKYREIYDLFLDVNKKISKKFREPQQLKWLDSLGINELAAAYCKFGDKCEWITLLKDNINQDKSIGKIFNAVIKKKENVPVNNYKFKGYIASLFGDVFSYCNEEAYCKIGNWLIIGPKNIIQEFANENAYYYNLEDYIKQTPVSSFLEEDKLIKTAINLKESPDTILAVFKPFLKERLENNLNLHNFEFLTVAVGQVEENIKVDINLYATNLNKLPVPKTKPLDGKEIFVVIDSTIHIDNGPFSIYDPIRKSNGYFEQLPNNRLRLCDSKKKGIWAIPFETSLCGNVEQVDYFNNSKLQMMFISDGKLYLLDMLARFVRGYPVKLEKDVLYGPKIIDNTDEKETTFMTLNVDNTISRYNIKGEKVKNWKDIKAPEFVRELPKLINLGEEKYWCFKLPTQTKLYKFNGEEVIITGKNKLIDKDSEIEYVGNNEIKVKSVDGKYYIFNLHTGKTKKAK